MLLPVNSTPYKETPPPELVQNLRRGHYALGIEEPTMLRAAAAFTELAVAISSDNGNGPSLPPLRTTQQRRWDSAYHGFRARDTDELCFFGADVLGRDVDEAWLARCAHLATGPQGGRGAGGHDHGDDDSGEDKQ